MWKGVHNTSPYRGGVMHVLLYNTTYHKNALKLMLIQLRRTTKHHTRVKGKRKTSEEVRLTTLKHNDEAPSEFSHGNSPRSQCGWEQDD